MKKIVLFLASTAMLTGCLEQRDLYNASGTVLHVDSDWHTCLDEDEMMDATVLLYRNEEMTKEYHSRPNGVTIPVTNGHYDVLLINGTMETEEKTNLEYINFRGTESMHTFEAYVAEGSPSGRLGSSDGEYIAHNDMCILAFANGEVDIDSESKFHLKYDNGKKIISPDGEEIDVITEYTPRAATYRFKVRMNNILNPRSAKLGAGALRGFAGSTFLVTPHGIPQAGFTVTHHVNLSTPGGEAGRVRPSDNDEAKEVGTVESPLFTSFGPCLSEHLHELEDSDKYFFDPKFILADGTEFSLGAPIDVTSQVNAITEHIHAHHSGEGDIAHEDNFFLIEIDDYIHLPVIDPDKVVDVIPWDDEEIIMVWI